MKAWLLNEDVSPVLPTDVVLAIYKIGFENLDKRFVVRFQCQKKIQGF